MGDVVVEGLVMKVDMVGGRWVDCVPAGRGWRGIGASLRFVSMRGWKFVLWIN